MDSRSDSVVMQKVRDGEVAKLAVLFERHHRTLYNFFLRMTANREWSEDLVQDVFFRMLKYRHTYLPGTQFTGWMYQIARNAHHDSWARRKSEVPEAEAEPASREPDPSEFVRRKQEIALLRRALAALEEDKREVLVLSRFQELKYDQIAEILGCDVGAVKVRVYRAVKALGQLFFELAGEKAS